MLAHSFDRFYVIAKFTLPSIGDLKFSALHYDDTCMHLGINSICSVDKKRYMLDLRLFINYIALNSETYISIMQQELRTCKRIGYEFYCKELFIVKQKSSYSCESAIYFNLDEKTIKENCKFHFYYNKTDVTPTVLDGGNEII